MRSAVIVLAGLLTSFASFAGEQIIGMASVIDGDTIEIHGQHIRLNGIDAPESGQLCTLNGAKYRCGQKAALALSDFIGRRTVSCEQRDTDRYGRMVATCFAAGEDLGAWMVSHGHALAYRKYSHQYVPAEESAAAAKVGIWAGEFVPPWEWRHGKRLPQETANVVPLAAKPATGCNIKGNISSSGERIYHMPGQHGYEETVISPNKGERWFCSEAEAVAAGWRKAKN